MVYSNKFVFCVLLDGRPQKELANGQVSLPFGTEYSLRFRNKNNRRAVVEIWIDGENVSGNGYIIAAHDYVDIKRHHDIDRSFKFVSLDSEDAIEHGKNGPNHDKVKGTIEARFRLEEERPKVIYRDVHHDHHHHHDHYVPRPIHPWYERPIWLTSANDNSGQPTYKSGGEGDGMCYPSGHSNCSTGGGKGMSAGGLISNDTYASPDEGGMDMECSTGGGTQSSLGPRKMRSRSKTTTLNFDDVATFKRINAAPEPLQDGCTVEGYSTGQTFRTVHIDLESAETSLKLFLVGFEEDVEEVAEVRKASRKKRRTAKDDKVSDLTDENQRLRQELEDLKKSENLESENKQLEAEIRKEKSKKTAKKRTKKRVTKT